MGLNITLKNLRKNIGYTQQQVADKLAIPRSTYKNYEDGVASPDIALLKKIVAIYQISVDALISDELTDRLLEDARIESDILDSVIKLKEYRLKAGLTQKQVAEKLGIGMQAYAYYEKAEREPSLSTLCKLADFFGVTVDEILGRVPEQQLFEDARVPKPYYQQLFEALNTVDRARVEGYMERLLEDSGVALVKKKA